MSFSVPEDYLAKAVNPHDVEAMIQDMCGAFDERDLESKQCIYMRSDKHIQSDVELACNYVDSLCLFM